jgi:recombination protein RecA
MFGTGINKLGCLVDAGEAIGLIDRKGAWYSMGNIKLGQGRKSAMEFIGKDAKLMKDIEGKIQEKISSVQGVRMPMSVNGLDEVDENSVDN